MTPSYSRNRLSISLLTSVSSARLDGDEVVGHWQAEMKEFRSKSTKGTIVEQFLNWGGDPESILRFVQRYGPFLKWKPGEFRQPIKDWRERQGALRRIWSRGAALGYRIGMKEGEMLVIGRNELILGVDDLGRFLEFEIFSYPAARRRVCERPDCPNPFFIAAHQKTTLCSEVCKAWKQRQHQLKWWAEHGERWRAGRKRAPGGKKGHNRGSRRSGDAH